MGQLVADVPSGLSLTPPQETKQLTYVIRSTYTLRCRGCSFFNLIILQTVGLLGQVIRSSLSLYLTQGNTDIE
jgi:hypothetical protein